MKKITLITGSIFIIIILGLSGCVNPSNKTLNVPLNEIALTQDDVGLYKKDEKHITEPYTAENATGNDISWNVIEHYQSLFAENSSGPATQAADSVIQSITKLESKDKAQYYLDLKQKHLVEVLNYSAISIQTIGDKSFYLKKITYSLEGEIVVAHMVVFSIADVVVVLGGPATDDSTFIGYAKIIEANIMDAINKS